jgi:1-acyl-sn-glycerol-3-phosphate acyltransferase
MKSGSRIQKIVGWVITPLYLLLFISILVVFHLFQLIAGTVSRRAQYAVLNLMNVCIVWNIRIVTGASFKVFGAPLLPIERPVIIVSNHQSMYDIPMLMWICRGRHLAFISKKELGRGIPSVSLALRTLGSVLIDRKDAKGAVATIERFGRETEAAKQVACIFPEGTRARDGAMRRFKGTGLQVLLAAMPSALIQPVAIAGNWELLRYRFLPVPFGTSASITFLPPVEPAGIERAEIVALIEGQIRSVLGQPLMTDKQDDAAGA